jgi:hypothetical protein
MPTSYVAHVDWSVLILQKLSISKGQPRLTYPHCKLAFTRAVRPIYSDQHLRNLLRPHPFPKISQVPADFVRGTARALRYRTTGCDLASCRFSGSRRKVSRAARSVSAKWGDIPRTSRSPTNLDPCGRDIDSTWCPKRKTLHQ